MQFKASAPGSLMLLGEYAVLYGKKAVVCAVNKRLTVTLTPRADTRIEIHSIQGDYVTDLANLQIEKPFHFVLGMLKHYQSQLNVGCRIDIAAEFSDQVGLGSSAAVSIATLACLNQWLKMQMSALDMVREGKRCVIEVQGVGSGADIAASVYGGIVAYQSEPLFAEKLALVHPLTALYAGFKTPTVQAIKHVQDYFSLYPPLFTALMDSIGHCAEEGIKMIRRGDFKKLGQLLNIQQGMMEALGVSSPLLYDMCDALRKQPEILGAKISGSGLGDCVIGLGHLPDNYIYSKHAKVERVALAMTLQGVCCEKS